MFADGDPPERYRVGVDVDIGALLPIRHPRDAWLWSTLDGEVVDWRTNANIYPGVIVAAYERDIGADTWKSWGRGWDCASACVWRLALVSTVSAACPIPLPAGREDARSRTRLTPAPPGA